MAIASEYYVTMTDKFMSGWGLAKDKISKLVIVCKTPEQVDQAVAIAQRKSEMKHISVRTTRPNYPEDRYHTTFSEFEKDWGYKA